MSDRKRPIRPKRKKRHPELASGYDAGVRDFQIGALLRQAREEAGMSQGKLATLIHTKKSAISRLENHAHDVKLSTVRKVAKALGKRLELHLV